VLQIITVTVFLFDENYAKPMGKSRNLKQYKPKKEGGCGERIKLNVFCKASN
jgi:hypothetical protein